MWILPGKQKSKGGEEREYNVEEASTLREVKKKRQQQHYVCQKIIWNE